MTGSVDSVSVIGLREHQEDRFVVARVDDGWLLAVFDGHGGDGTAEVAAALVEDAFLESRGAGGGGEATVDAAICAIARNVADRVEGSSASVAWIDEGAGRVAVGILGDSPVIVRDAGGRVVCGPLHNTAFARDDVESAIERGAVYVGGYLVDPDTRDGVNLTRTIGDAELGFLGREPETLSLDVGDGSYVLVASDGLFTPALSDAERLLDHVDALIDDGAGAEDLARQAIEHGSFDNVTVVLWKANPGPVVG